MHVPHVIPVQLVILALLLALIHVLLLVILVTHALRVTLALHVRPVKLALKPLAVPATPVVVKLLAALVTHVTFTFLPATLPRVDKKELKCSAHVIIPGNPYSN